MSYREKQKTERLIEVLSKLAVLFYIIVAVEIVAYIVNIKVLFTSIRSIAIERYAIVVVATALVGYILSKVADRVKEEFVKKLKFIK
ncbi:MAG: hypothetical protein E7262_10360 [Lachnospiraceae bacterium]|nr:hypothetical protein [Lachnospiraceae bacterium]